MRAFTHSAKAVKRRDAQSGGEIPVRSAAGGRFLQRHSHGRGDLAGDPEQVAALLDQGLRTFSVVPGALGPVRAAIARYSGVTA